MNATITVERLIASAPTAGGRTNPHGASTPAASGIALVEERAPFGRFMGDLALLYGIFAGLLVAAFAARVLAARRPARTLVWSVVALIFAGSLLAGAPRVIEVKGMDLDAPFAPRMLYVNNLDKPGFIGALGAILADAGVNIATFNLGRREALGEAVALVAVDGDVPADVVARLAKLEGVRNVVPLKF